MKILSFFSYFIFALISVGTQQCSAQQPENWTASQLMEPATLAKTLQSDKNVPLIYCVGPGAVIPHSIYIGMTNDKKNLENFKDSISRLPRNADVVVYCGCCPFDHCPNVRPAIAALKQMKFTNFHLLNLPKNIRTDWIAKGYPTIEEK